MIIGANHVFIRLTDWPEVRIQAYADGVDIADRDKAYFTCKRLTNGLWLRSNRTEPSETYVGNPDDGDS